MKNQKDLYVQTVQEHPHPEGRDAKTSAKESDEEVRGGRSFKRGVKGK